MLGKILYGQAKYAEAEELFRGSLAVREKIMADDWRTFSLSSLLGGALAAQKKFDAAEPLLIAGYEGMKSRELKIGRQNMASLKEALERLEAFYASSTQPQKAAAWKAKRDEFDAAASPLESPSFP
jgi:hypothetical protein